MRKALPLAAAALVCGLGSVASAAVLYNETFSTNGPVSTYVGAGKVFVSEFGTSAMAGASDGKLTFGFVGGQGADNLGSVASSLGANQSLVSLKFDITPKSYSAGSLRFVAGDTTDLTWVGWDPIARSWGNFLLDSNGISIQGGAALPFTMNQNHTLSVFLNDSGAAQSYVGPDEVTTYTLADNTWSVFDGTTPLAQGIAKGGTASIAYVGMLAARNWGGAQTLSDIDNLVIRDDMNMYPVPEPTSLGLLGAGGLLFLRRHRSAK